MDILNVWLAIDENNLDFLKKYYQAGYFQMKDISGEPNMTLGYRAAKLGHYEIVKWLMENGVYFDQDSTFWAANKGYLKILKYLHKNNVMINGIDCSLQAVGNGHLHILKWLEKKKFPFCWMCCQQAAFDGHFEILKWLRKKNKPWYKTCPSAAYGGHLEILQWAKDNGCPLKKNKCLKITKNPKITEWLMRIE